MILKGTSEPSVSVSSTVTWLEVSLRPFRASELCAAACLPHLPLAVGQVKGHTLRRRETRGPTAKFNCSAWCPHTEVPLQQLS